VDQRLNRNTEHLDRDILRIEDLTIRADALVES